MLLKKQKELKIVTEHKPPTCHEKAEPGDLVAVHYTGRLDSGAIFDSSVQQGREPIQFQLGAGKVIPGWEQGITGMCVGPEIYQQLLH
ncbi:uncharacterized protein [Amphiura filiformis]|uniref:uncharacterized protein n=1 Tax=Amphiura filiformis TaxID=82378 RepID=UPI003B22145C